MIENQWGYGIIPQDKPWGFQDQMEQQPLVENQVGIQNPTGIMTPAGIVTGTGIIQGLPGCEHGWPKPPHASTAVTAPQ